MVSSVNRKKVDVLFIAALLNNKDAKKFAKTG